jgi:predicted hydrolase (HD superfamily)
MDISLLACDELADFVIACCLVRPEGISTPEPKSVKKKLKDKAFGRILDTHGLGQQPLDRFLERFLDTHRVSNFKQWVSPIY